ncbi:hypothetical protein GCM10017691_43640 [Pseudonocardia petroleophila]|uniref:Thioredoxin domain-containing protein n=1 Tax=Pseudonocardia petroleophila TaxID=37331 RepID=A0A7G7MB05_9PSEU|nr:hypothetical protein [Pseudonocardia petroleophila]QNG49966.1 hypothetical protein H6H00_16935 [Pseudonocardia petroleophila]
MTLPLAVALLALLVALFALVALVAVYARVRALESGRAAELSGYAPVVGRPAPAAVRPRPGESGALVAVVDADCSQCHEVHALLGEVSRPGLRFAAVADRAGFGESLAELVVDHDVRAELFEGYSPTVLALDARGVVTHRRFVYADTDVRGLLLDLIAEHEVTRA